jgi:hypothetical protein
MLRTKCTLGLRSFLALLDIKTGPLTDTRCWIPGISGVWLELRSVWYNCTWLGAYFVRDFRTSAHYGTVPKRDHVADACGASDGARRSDSTPGSYLYGSVQNCIFTNDRIPTEANQVVRNKTVTSEHSVWFDKNVVRNSDVSYHGRRRTNVCIR